MSRDQRVIDNWALLFASELASQHKLPFVVIYALDPFYPGANFRHYHFMLAGLQLLEKQLDILNISLIIRTGKPVEKLIQTINELHISCLITDFDPFRIIRYMNYNGCRRLFDVDAYIRYVDQIRSRFFHPIKSFHYFWNEYLNLSLE